MAGNQTLDRLSQVRRRTYRTPCNRRHLVPSLLFSVEKDALMYDVVTVFCVDIVMVIIIVAVVVGLLVVVMIISIAIYKYLQSKRRARR